MEIVLNIILGLLSGTPLPLALLSRRSFERSYPPPGFARLARNVVHFFLLLTGVTVPWFCNWLSNHYTESRAGNNIAFIVSMFVAIFFLIVKFRLHDSKTWQPRFRS